MNQLFLVAIPNGPIMQIAEDLREKINKKFNIYDNILPTLHTTIEVLEINDEKELQECTDIISTVCSQFSKFMLEVKGFEFFEPPHKAITLAIRDNYFIENLSYLLHERLAQRGFTSRGNFDKWKFHITIAGIFGTKREWSIEEFYEACEMVKDIPVQSGCEIDKLVLWRPVVDPDKKEVKVFELKETE